MSGRMLSQVKIKSAMSKFFDIDPSEAEAFPNPISSRALTFTIMRWFGKPAIVNALECARRGWMCVEQDTLRCEFCESQLIWNPSTSSAKRVVDQYAMKFAELLNSHHKELCPCYGNPIPLPFPSSLAVDAPYSLARLATMLRSGVAPPQLSERFISAVEPQLPLLEPLVPILSAYLASKSITTNLSPDTIKVYILIAATGWYVKDSKACVLECSCCSRRVGLWNLAAFSSLPARLASPHSTTPPPFPEADRAGNDQLLTPMHPPTSLPLATSTPSPPTPKSPPITASFGAQTATPAAPVVAPSVLFATPPSDRSFGGFGFQASRTLAPTTPSFGVVPETSLTPPATKDMKEGLEETALPTPVASTTPAGAVTPGSASTPAPVSQLGTPTFGISPQASTATTPFGFPTPGSGPFGGPSFGSFGASFGAPVSSSAKGGDSQPNASKGEGEESDVDSEAIEKEQVTGPSQKGGGYGAPPSPQGDSEDGDSGEEGGEGGSGEGSGEGGSGEHSDGDLGDEELSEDLNEYPQYDYGSQEEEGEEGEEGHAYGSPPPSPPATQRSYTNVDVIELSDSDEEDAPPPQQHTPRSDAEESGSGEGEGEGEMSGEVPSVNEDGSSEDMESSGSDQPIMARVGMPVIKHEEVRNWTERDRAARILRIMAFGSDEAANERFNSSPEEHTDEEMAEPIHLKRGLESSGQESSGIERRDVNVKRARTDAGVQAIDPADLSEADENNSVHAEAASTLPISMYVEEIGPPSAPAAPPPPSFPAPSTSTSPEPAALAYPLAIQGTHLGHAAQQSMDLDEDAGDTAGHGTGNADSARVRTSPLRLRRVEIPKKLVPVYATRATHMLFNPVQEHRTFCVWRQWTERDEWLVEYCQALRQCLSSADSPSSPRSEFTAKSMLDKVKSTLSRIESFGNDEV